MTERERLIELLKKSSNKVSEYIMENDTMDYIPTTDELYGVTADYLLENGVIVLPELKYKQILYFIYNERVKPLEVSSYTIRPEFNNLLQIHLYKNGFNGCCTTDDIGKTVFLTKEEAEKALEGGAKMDKEQG